MNLYAVYQEYSFNFDVVQTDYFSELYSSLEAAKAAALLKAREEMENETLELKEQSKTDKDYSVYEAVLYKGNKSLYAFGVSEFTLQN